MSSPRKKPLRFDTGFDVELWKDQLRTTDKLKDSAFEKKSSTATFEWELRKLPYKRNTEGTKIEFKTNLCDDERTWNLIIYQSLSNECTLGFDLRHAGKSSCCINPSIAVTFYKDDKMIATIKENHPKSLSNKDWDTWNFQFNNNATVPPISRIVDKCTYVLKIQLTITYDVEMNNFMECLWSNAEDGPYTDLHSTLTVRREKADLTIVSGHDEFYVERNMLVKRSDVFYSMYKHEINDGMNELRIDDIDSKVVYEMINFIYTGKINNLDRYVFDLLVLADRFRIRKLIEKCEEQLSSNLTISNMRRVIDAAEKYKLGELKEHIGNYLANMLTHDFKKSLSNSMFEEVVCGIYNSI